MSRGSGKSAKTGLSGPVFLFAGALLLVLSPLIRGGNRHVALIMLEALALLVLPLLIWRLCESSGRPGMPVAAVTCLALAPLWAGLLQLTPIPPEVWAMLPGREPYLPAMSAIQMPQGIWRPVSLMPDASWLSVLAGVPIAVMFLLGLLASKEHLSLLVRLIAVSAFLQAIIGLLQVGLLKELYFGALAYDRAIGSFANPNHLASYLAMALPLVILLLRRTLAEPEVDNVREGRSRGRRKGLSQLFTGARRPVLIAWWSTVLFFTLAALLASLSRGGLAAGLIVGLAAALLFPSRDLTLRARRWRIAGVLVIAFVVAASVGIDGLLQRVVGPSGNSDGGTRWHLFLATWQGAVTYFPFGSGLGSYAGVFPRFQPSSVTGFAEYAHSDYIQLLMETGVLFVLLAALALRMAAKQFGYLSKRLRKHPGDPAALLQASCGLGLLAILLHSWLDFNLRIPANAMLAASLFGAYLRPACARSTRGTHHAPDTEPGMG